MRQLLAGSMLWIITCTLSGQRYEPISGASVFIAATAAGAFTDEISNYHLEAELDTMSLFYEADVAVENDLVNRFVQQLSLFPQEKIHLHTDHWQPIVRTDSLGVASFEFYTADDPSSYTVIIESLTTDGRIIRQAGKLWRKDF